ncbi:MAG: MFS transporter [Sediminibacterium sp.]|nr:MFS transporter [Sediminibacterium sp.]
MKSNRIPSAIKYIIGNEAAERFSYYGLRAILTVYLATHFFNPTADPSLQAGAEAKANEATHFFITLNYLLPIAGALLADWFFGKYKIIVWLSLVYCVGNLIMAAFTDQYSFFMLGLILIAVGSGGIKPCVSANVGDQFDDSNKDLISKAFSWFYLSINFGSFFSTLLIPFVYERLGASWAFGIPGGLMLLATLLFFMGRKHYRHVPPTGFPRANFFSINVYAFKNRHKRSDGTPLLNVALEKYNPTAVEGVKAVWKVLLLFSFVPVYWMLSDQSTSEWVIQATKLDLSVFGFTLLPQQVQAANPVLILILTPLFTGVLYPFLEKRGIRFNEHRKLLSGYVLLLLAFVVIYVLQVKIDAGQQPSVGWQLLAYVLQTAAEILVYLTGLEYAYAQAPASMKSTIMSFWLLTISLGNYLVSLINNNMAQGGMLSHLHGSAYYLFFIVLMVGITVLFGITYFKKLVHASDTPLSV